MRGKEHGPDLSPLTGPCSCRFYWHFADIGAFHAAILKYWRDVAAAIGLLGDVEAGFPVGRPRPRLGNCESDQARAKQGKTRNGADNTIHQI
jgi:hypothetical protein